MDTYCFGLYVLQLKIGNSWCFRSPLFRLYLSEMESQLRGCSSTLRFCACLNLLLFTYWNIFQTYDPCGQYFWYHCGFILSCRCCSCSEDKEHNDCEYIQLIAYSFLFHPVGGVFDFYIHRISDIRTCNN